MAKRKQSKSSATGKKASVGTSKEKSTNSNRGRKAPSVESASVQTLFQKTRHRIRDIAKRALSKLRGGDKSK